MHFDELELSRKSDDIVYVISDGIGHYKVGSSSKKIVNRRLRDLQIGNAMKLKIARCFLFERGQAFAVEMESHQVLSPYHIRGEWFRADIEDIVNGVKKAVARLEKRRTGMNDLHLIYKEMSAKQSESLSMIEAEHEERKSIFDMMLEDTESYPRVRRQLRK